MSVTNGMRPVHPGEILAEELEELGMSANAMAKALSVPTNRITAILKGQRGGDRRHRPTSVKVFRDDATVLAQLAEDL